MARLVRGPPTRTEYQRAVFTKLTLVYVVNNVMIPFLVALLPVGVNQGWYERGGAVNQAFITIVLNIVFTEGLKLFQYMALFNRYIRAPFVVSQQRKNELWQPPEMPLGEMYAATVKAVALTLVYAPMAAGVPRVGGRFVPRLLVQQARHHLLVRRAAARRRGDD